MLCVVLCDQAFRRGAPPGLLEMFHRFIGIGDAVVRRVQLSSDSA
jgi:hypothetical protein